MLENTDIAIERDGHIHQSKSNGDVLPLESPEPIICLVLVLQALKVRRLYALGNECISVGRHSNIEKGSHHPRDVLRRGVRIGATVLGQLYVKETLKLGSGNVL